jgi:hypothetical protein
MSATEHHSRRQDFAWRTALVVSTLALSWLLMQVVHEFGHVLHAWASGGIVVRVVLHPLEISRTDVSPNPRPQFVAWGGAAWGSLIPLLMLVVVRWGGKNKMPRRAGGVSPLIACLVANHQGAAAPRSPDLETSAGWPSWLATFFAGFCLIANGAYLAIGLLDGIGDAGDLVANGAPAWSLIAFGAVTIPAGLWLWHGLGPRLGFVPIEGQISRRTVIAVLVTLVCLVGLEIATG